MRLSGPDVIISTTGFYLYNGTPALGNPPVFYESSASSDPFGNAVTPNVARSVSGNAFAQLGSGALLAQDSSGDQIQITGAAISFSPSGVGLAGTIQTNGTNELDFLAPATPGGNNQAEIGLISSATIPTINIGANGLPSGNQINLNGSVAIPAGDGPFISGEGWHNLTNPSGITGTARVKKLPWNAVWFEGDVTWSGTTGATLTFGAPPDSSYSPASSVRRPVASTGIPSAVSAAPRLFIPSGGTGPQLITQTVTAANSQYGWSIMYPTN